MPERIAVIGSGWEATLSQKLDDKKFEVIVISPEAKTPYTPLLAAAATGMFNLSLAEEPIRHKSKNIRFMQAKVEDIDFQKKSIHCTPAFKELEKRPFDLEYDRVIITPGTTNQTFGTKGVEEHALFLRTVKDAYAVRSRIEDIVEQASLPHITDDERRDMLRVIVVGGGPIGVEVSAELSDLVRGDLAQLYPGFKDKFTIEVHDVADQILPMFEKSLAGYAQKSFVRKDVKIHTSSHITEVQPGKLFTKERGEIGFGMLIWATGNKQVSLVDTLKVSKSEKLPRILTNDRLQVLDTNGEPMKGVYALGDAADVKGGELPTTAEVACQKAEYLSNAINTGLDKPFEYSSKAMIAYTGSADGVAAGQKEWSGASAWMAWRAKNLDWSRSWRNRILIGVNWGLNHVFGKETFRN
ncbi:hypothetical protein AMS68_003237 [Peltaster fructicola]|uniref:FAD/NAD(P)-binding domain-containing protein n=1 Tax=Peltaster fructicola TaxID=286661 RepID=A0A6H0XTD4_9PEZI|nr:hypothetical protein AMS68_003237 [Peltaster fructicola]